MATTYKAVKIKGRPVKGVVVKCVSAGSNVKAFPICQGTFFAARLKAHGWEGVEWLVDISSPER